MTDNPRDDNERKKKNLVLCCDQNEVATIVTCLAELKHTIDCVLECTHDHSSGIKERIILCKLLDEIRQIENKLDNPLFGLNEIKHEIIDINNIITNSTFGLREIKNEVRDIESLLTNQFFGLNEIKNEIITINDLLNNTTFGIPEIKNEIRIIENRTAITNNLLTNEIFGLNEIKNEIRGIENAVANLPNSLNINIFNSINNTVDLINNTLNNSIFGLNEIKNEIRFIENSTAITNNLLTNEIFGLNEIKNEIRGIENGLQTLNRPLNCALDSVRICGCEVGDATIHSIQTDKNSILIEIPQGSAYSQIGRTFTIDQFRGISDPSLKFVIDLVNPVDSGRILYLERIYGGATLTPTNQPLSYQSSIGIFLEADAVLAPGTPLTPINLNAGSSETSVMDVIQRTTVIGPSAATSGNFIQIGGLYSLDYRGQIIVPPGHSMSVFLRNFVAVPDNTLNFTISIVWYELDE